MKCKFCGKENLWFIINTDKGRNIKPTHTVYGCLDCGRITFIKIKED